MKSFTSILILFLLSFSINAQEFKFESETIDYGKIDKGANGERIFTFSNIGDQPIIIKNIQSSCGCTVPKKPEKPVMPGEKGEIKVSYDTNRVGGFSKSITIFSNATEAAKVIRIKGIVNNGVSLEKEKSMLSDSQN
ncbi:hypothetical protein BST83_09660 [Polaribacter filamentus]|jgi:hypothetical protein|uniref:DUF1573 domain-containing protein n=1 Tax=Polaribacter filamentus TaxID=53483 RepID=A0A2S7KXN8_9FLAO|nr:DUF1573 domain-containing protein [Polaribacter filamentus]PQB07397.1 hypothetical protein BST83_09660 [Polaribacter filamentus]